MKAPKFISTLLDYTLFFILLTAVGLNTTLSLVLLFILPFLYVPVETVLLKVWKTTPGRFLFGRKLLENYSWSSIFKYSLKRGSLILPLLLPPLNIFFAVFYLKETKESKKRRWNILPAVKFSKKQRSRRSQIFVIAASLLFSTLYFFPSGLKSELYSITKQEFDLNNWVEVKDPLDAFSVHFPTKPTVEKKDVEVEQQNTTLNVTEYTHDDDITYQLQTTKVPSSWTFLGSNYLFKALSKELVTYQGKIVSQSFKKHGRFPSMEYLLDNHESGQTKGVLILVKKKLYRLEVQSKKTLTETEILACDGFISSFQAKT